MNQFGMIFGRTPFEKRPYVVLRQCEGFEIRKYPACVAASVASTAFSSEKSFRKEAFYMLGKYFGVIGDHPQNVAERGRAERIGMTSPVRWEKHEGQEGGRDVLSMTFFLPTKYKKVKDAPVPTDERVEVKDVPAVAVGVLTFRGNVSTVDQCKSKVEKLKEYLQRDGFKTIGEWSLDRMNPWFCLPFLKQNEVSLPLDPQSVPVKHS